MKFVVLASVGWRKLEKEEFVKALQWAQAKEEQRQWGAKSEHNKPPSPALTKNIHLKAG